MKSSPLADQLTRLADHSLIRPLDELRLTYIFTHALIQESAYESTLRQDRQTLHRQVAQVYERLFSERLEEFGALIAQHYAEAGEDAQTVKFAMLAGDADRRRYAFPEARLNYELALQALAQMDDRDENLRRKVDVLLNEVDVSFMTRAPAQSLERLEQASQALQAIETRGTLATADRRRRARTHFLTGRAHSLMFEGSHYIHMYQLARDEAAELGDESLQTVAEANIGRILATRGRYGEARRLLAPAIDALARMEQWREWVMAVPNFSLALLMQGERAEGLARCAEALAQAERMGYVYGQTYCHFTLSLLHLFAGETALSLAHSRIAHEMALQSRDPGFVFWASVTMAWALLREGDLTAAAHRIELANAVSRNLGDTFFLRELSVYVEAEFYFTRGDMERAALLAEQAIQIARKAENLLLEGYALRLAGQIAAASGPEQRSTAQARLEQSLHVFESGEASLEAARTRALLDRVSSG